MRRRQGAWQLGDTERPLAVLARATICVPACSRHFLHDSAPCAELIHLVLRSPAAGITACFTSPPSSSLLPLPPCLASAPSSCRTMLTWNCALLTMRAARRSCALTGGIRESWTAGTASKCACRPTLCPPSTTRTRCVLAGAAGAEKQASAVQELVLRGVDPLNAVEA